MKFYHLCIVALGNYLYYENNKEVKKDDFLYKLVPIWSPYFSNKIEEIILLKNVWLKMDFFLIFFFEFTFKLIHGKNEFRK